MKRRALALAAAAIMCVSVAGCAKTAKTAKTAKSQEGAFSVVSVQEEGKQKANADYLETEDYQKLSQLKESIDKFSEKLTGSLDESSFVFSSFSAYQALAAVSLGADGETLTQFEKAFYPEGWTRQDFIKYNALLLAELGCETDSAAAKVNNIALISDKYNVNKDFANDIYSALNARAAKVDFASADEATKQINDWVKQNTNGMIDPMLNAPLDASTIAAIINTVYFRGEWTKKFDEKNNKEGEFTGKSGKQNVTYMNAKELSAEYARNKSVQALKLTYTNGPEMTIYLPEKGVSPKDALSQKVRNNLDFSEGIGSLSMPKFEMATDFDLEKAAKAAGLDKMFEGGLGKTVEDADLYVSEIIQKAKIKVDETGTEAAAATVVAETKAAIVDPVKFDMNVNRSFAYTIEQNGVVLFSGVVNDIKN